MRTTTNDKPTSSELAKLAITIDKYDCAVAMSLQMTTWLGLKSYGGISREGDQDRVNLLTIAYISNTPTTFSDIGSRIVMENVESMTNLDVFSDDLHLRQLLGKSADSFGPDHVADSFD